MANFRTDSSPGRTGGSPNSSGARVTFLRWSLDTADTGFLSDESFITKLASRLVQFGA